MTIMGQSPAGLVCTLTAMPSAKVFSKAVVEAAPR
jgi:carboxylesterase type B